MPRFGPCKLIVAVATTSEVPTSGLEPLTCSLRVRSHAFAAVSRRFKTRLDKPYLPILRFRMLPGVRPGYCHGYCQPLSKTRFAYRRAKYTPKRMTAPPTIFSIPRTSPKKTIPEAIPVTVTRYW